MVQIDFHLRCPRLMGQRVDSDLLHFTILVDVVVEGFKLIDGIDTVGLAATFGSPRASDRRLQGIILVQVGFDQEKLQLRRYNGLPTPFLIIGQDPAQHLARRHLHRLGIAVEGIVDELGRCLFRPGDQAYGRRVGAHYDIDFGR